MFIQLYNMSTKEIFSEFLALSYYPGRKPTMIKDIGLKEYMIVRQTPVGWYVMSLYNGTTIFIPWDWIDLFGSLDIWGGHRVLTTFPTNPIENTILDFLTLIITLRKHGEEPKFMETLGRIAGKGTEEFRKWFKEETGKTLYPIEYTSLNKYKQI